MRINQLASKNNLQLAWRRITTGGNYQYKRFYRPIYYAYEVALDANLADLQQRLLGRAFKPQHPERVYVPKASGLHRPLSLLNIKRARSVEEAVGMLPSIPDPHHEGIGTEKLDKTQALRTANSAVGERPYRVTDKSRLRFVLFRAEPDGSLLNLVLRIVRRHPEHADAFFHYLGQFSYRKPIERLCLDLVENNPYSYIHGEAWHVLARYNRKPGSMTAALRAPLIDRAIEIARDKSTEKFVEKWGACHFLCVAEEIGGGQQSRWLRYQAPLQQALLAPGLPDGAFRRGEVVERFLRRSSPEPGLSVCSALHERGLALSALGLTAGRIPSQAANTLRELGVISSLGPRIDPIAEILSARYGVPSMSMRWAC